MRRATLEKIGGFEPFVRHLAEDHAIGEAVRLAGEKVSIPPFTVAHACVETSARQLIAHELRWSRTIRRVDPLGHLGSALGSSVRIRAARGHFSAPRLVVVALALATCARGSP